MGCFKRQRIFVPEESKFELTMGLPLVRDNKRKNGPGARYKQEPIELTPKWSKAGGSNQRSRQMTKAGMALFYSMRWIRREINT